MTTTRHATKASRLDRVRRARGVDWFPSWAVSPVDYWNASMPRQVARRELTFVRDLGLDHVRIWLSARGYEADSRTYLDNLRYVLDTAEHLGLGVVMELFDSCGIEPTAPTMQSVKVEEVPGLAEGTPQLATVLQLGGDRARDLFGAPAMVTVPYRGDAMVAVWEGFVPNPGYDHLGKALWPRWEAYASAIVEAVADHPAMLLLEIMNEPFVTQLGLQVDFEPVVEFYSHFASFVRPLAPELPLAIGAAQPFMAIHDTNCPDLDVVSFHSLSGASAMGEAIAAAKSIAGDRPAYLSEWGYFPGGPDGDQLDETMRLLPIVEDAEIAWAITHLIAGYGPFATTALLYPSGVMRPAALELRKRLASAATGDAASSVSPERIESHTP